MATAHERIQDLHSLLDINLDHFLEVLGANEAMIEKYVGTDAEQPLADYVSGMQSGVSQLPIQAIAAMSDDILHQIVCDFGNPTYH